MALSPVLSLIALLLQALIVHGRTKELNDLLTEANTTLWYCTKSSNGVRRRHLKRVKKVLEKRLDLELTNGELMRSDLLFLSLFFSISFKEKYGTDRKEEVSSYNIPPQGSQHTPILGLDMKPSKNWQLHIEKTDKRGDGSEVHTLTEPVMASAVKMKLGEVLEGISKGTVKYSFGYSEKFGVVFVNFWKDGTELGLTTNFLYKPPNPTAPVYPCYSKDYKEEKGPTHHQVMGRYFTTILQGRFDGRSLSGFNKLVKNQYGKKWDLWKQEVAVRLVYTDPKEEPKATEDENRCEHPYMTILNGLLALHDPLPPPPARR